MSGNSSIMCYPQLANYDIPIGYFVRNGLGIGYMPPPSTTKRTIELGAKYSPDFVCAPFKCMLGNYIEALEKGANIMISTGGTCRLGYYGELHEQILRDLGYDFKMFNLTLFNYKGLLSMLKGMKEFAPDTNLFKMALTLPAVAKMIADIDKIEDYYRLNVGFEIEDGAFDCVYNKYISDLRNAKGLHDVRCLYRDTMNRFMSIPKNKPEDPIRIGVVGEYFTIMDPASNHEIEKKLAKMGAEVHRWMNLSNSVLICPEKRTIRKLKHYINYDLHKFPSSIWVDIQKKECSKYVSFDTGGSSVSTVALAEHYAKKGFDGIVHVKSFGCTPEMDCVPTLHNISADYKTPILFLSYDTQTSDTGIETRLEAFYDMLSMGHISKKENR